MFIAAASQNDRNTNLNSLLKIKSKEDDNIREKKKKKGEKKKKEKKFIALYCAVTCIQDMENASKYLISLLLVLAKLTGSSTLKWTKNIYLTFNKQEVVFGFSICKNIFISFWLTRSLNTYIEFGRSISQNANFLLCLKTASNCHTTFTYCQSQTITQDYLEQQDSSYTMRNK